MPEPQPERRSSRRFALNLPLTVSFADGLDGEHGKAGDPKNATGTHSLDVSARGICFYVDAPIANGAPIEFTLTLPPEITLTESIRVRCKGKVVRVDEGAPNNKVAVAAVIDEYEFLSES